jgi:hypothetical protein
MLDLVSVALKAERSDSELSLGSAAARVGRVSMTAELDRLSLRQLQHNLEALANLLEPLLALLLLLRTTGISTLTRSLTSGPGPETNTPKAFADVHDHTHDLIVVLVLERLADGGKHEVQPDIIVGTVAALEGVCPATAVLVLGVLPLWTHTLLEQVVVRLLREFGSRSDVVLPA